MTPESIGTALVGLFIAVATAYNGWQSVQAKREAKGARHHAQCAADNSHPVSNGFVGEVRRSLSDILTMATEARDAATRAEDKVDRHIEAHANAQVYPLPRRAGW